MTKHESRLLSRWAEHRKRGKVLFVLLRGIAPGFIGVLIGALAYWALSARHQLYWDGAAYMLAAWAVFGSIRAMLLWDKMEAAYVASRTRQS